LRLALSELLDAEPCVLTGFPDPRVEEREPPYDINLAAWAVTSAEKLHRQFGAEVKLRVGALAYPTSSSAPRRDWPHTPAERLNPDEIAVRLDGEAIVASGHLLQHGVMVENLTREDVTVLTNGHLTADVVDPATGEIVGVFEGPEHLPLVPFRIPPSTTVRVPLLIGTASLLPSLGYAVPPGSWGVEAPVRIEAGDGDSTRRKTPILPLTIVNG
jgi:hypothetical protein